MITSVNNGQVKNIIQLNQKTKARREQGLFVAEGNRSPRLAHQLFTGEWVLSKDDMIAELHSSTPTELII